MKLKKLLAGLLAGAMILSMGAFNAMAANGNGTVTVSVDKGENDYVPAGTYTYDIYKVFDADVSLAADGKTSTGINYKLVSGKTAAPEGFTATNGYITAAPSEITDTVIDNLNAYLTEADKVDTITITADGTTGTASGSKTLPYGYYFIKTTTGSVVAIDSTNPDWTIQDKNKLPSLDKVITTASEDIKGIGSQVAYQATVTAQPGAEGYVFHDKMTTGLTLDTTSVEVKVNDKALDSTNYTMVTNAVSSDTAENITITFKNEYLKTITKKTDIVITYTATINKDAAVDGENKNDAKLVYGDDTNTHEIVVPTPPVVKTYDFNVKKFDSDGTTALEGAEFDLYDAATGGNKITIKSDAAGKYYVAFDADVKDSVKIVAGNVNVRGLVAGTYYLEETKTPAGGYNMPTDRFTVTINADQATAVDVNVKNTKGTVLPSTGGMGTTMFYMIGAILVIGAGVVLVARKRMN